jgi:hypothetical protein
MPPIEPKVKLGKATRFPACFRERKVVSQQLADWAVTFQTRHKQAPKKDCFKHLNSGGSYSTLFVVVKMFFLTSDF